MMSRYTTSLLQENCPACFEEPKERYRVKTLLAQQEHLFPTLMESLAKAMEPLMTEDSFAACIGAAPATTGERPSHVRQKPTAAAVHEDDE